MVQFTSSSFSGSESSGEVVVTLMLSGGVSTSNITVMISLNGINATGYIIIHFNSIATLEYYIIFQYFALVECSRTIISFGIKFRYFCNAALRGVARPGHTRAFSRASTPFALPSPT